MPACKNDRPGKASLTKYFGCKLSDLCGRCFQTGVNQDPACCLTVLDQVDIYKQVFYSPHTGHFDHRGSLLELAEEWNVPVYCHHQERPYLTGKASYPPADPSVGGGVISLLSFTFPKGPINASGHLQELPENGFIKELSDWKWLHTPGHTPGHISLFREKDGVLLAGDAFVTNMQESVLAVISQKKSVCGPP